MLTEKKGLLELLLKETNLLKECSDIDDVITFTEDGQMMVTKVESKKFISKNIKHVAVFKKKDKRTVYNMIYRDGKKGHFLH